MPDTIQVQMVLDKVQTFLCQWLDCHLRRVYQTNFWQSAVLSVLTLDQRTNVEEDGAKTLEDLDFATLIVVFLGNFRVLRREMHLDSELPDMAKHVRKIRNLYAHKSSRNIAKPDPQKVRYHIETLHHFLEGLGADVGLLSEVDDLYGFIISNSSVQFSQRPTMILSNGITISVSSESRKTESIVKEGVSMQFQDFSSSEDKCEEKTKQLESMNDEKQVAPKLALPHCDVAKVEYCCKMVNFARAIYDDIFATDAKILDRTEKNASKSKGRGNWDYLVVLPFSGNAEKALRSANSAWGCPDSEPYTENGYVVWEFPYCDKLPEVDVEQIYPAGHVPLQFDAYIAMLPGTEYRPDSCRVSNNRNAVKRDAYWYLGNYFPRSFVETFCIYDYVLSKCLVDVRAGKDTLTICDIGIGSGGATYGLIWALRKQLYGDETFKKVKVYGFDWNANALKLFEELKTVMVDAWPIEYEFITTKMDVTADKVLERDAINEKVDFVLTSKCLQEIVQSETATEQIYKTYIKTANDIVSDTGLFSILETFDSVRISALNRAAVEIGEGRVILAPRSNGVGCVGEECIEMYSTRVRNRVDERILFAVAGPKSLSEKFPVWAPASRPGISRSDSDSEFNESTLERNN